MRIVTCRCLYYVKQIRGMMVKVRSSSLRSSDKIMYRILDYFTLETKEK